MNQKNAPGSDSPQLNATSSSELSELNDDHWMRRALQLAALAAESGEVPVGAVIVQNLKRPSDTTAPTCDLIAEAGNLKEINHDALGHAEVRAIQLASQALGRWRLDDCTLYVTLEPCVMCSGAIVHARLGRVVFGALDPKAGAVQSLYQILHDSRLNHSPLVTAGVLSEDCTLLLKDFFKSLRMRRIEKRGETGI